MKEIELFLDTFSSPALKLMAKGCMLETPYLRTKDQIIKSLRKVIFSEERLKYVLANLTKSEKFIMEYVKRKNTVSVEALKEILSTLSFGESIGTCLDRLFKYGLCFPKNSSWGYGTKIDFWRTGGNDNFIGDVWSPDDVTGLVQISPQNSLPSYELSGKKKERAVSDIQHDLFAMIKYIENKKIKALKSGEMSKKDFVEAGKLLKIQEKLDSINKIEDGGWIYLLKTLLDYLHLIEIKGNYLVAASEAGKFLSISPFEQVKVLYETWLEQSRYNEFKRIKELSLDEDKHCRGFIPDIYRVKSALRTVMNFLENTTEPGKWYHISDFINGIRCYDIDFLITRYYAPSYYSDYDGRGPDYKGIYPFGGNHWKDKLYMREDWDKVEGRFLRKILEEPLYWLGMVTLCYVEGELTGFKWTPYGAFALSLSGKIKDMPLKEKVILVQPNFDLLLETGQGTVPVQYHLERFCDSLGGDRVKTYHISKQSFYRGLQSGLAGNEIIKFLQEQSRTELSQNVIFTLKDWTSFYEKIVITRDAMIIETDTEAEMNDLLSEAPELFCPLSPVLAAGLNRDEILTFLRKRKEKILYFDYREEAGLIFNVTDDMKIEVSKLMCDWFTETEMGHFAYKSGETSDRIIFQMTERTLREAKKNGLTGKEILEYLQNHCDRKLPPDVILTVKGFTDSVPSLEIDDITVMATENKETMDDILSVEAFRKYILARFSDTVALIDRRYIKGLCKEFQKRNIALNGNCLNKHKEWHMSDIHFKPVQHGKTRFSILEQAQPKGKKDVKKPVYVQSMSESDIKEVFENLLPLTPRATRELLERAVKGKCTVRIDYKSGSDGYIIRKVNPFEIYYRGTTPYLHGYCHMRKEKRTFRIARIRRIEMLEETFENS
mgnify:CR=1 FL=1